MSPLLHKISRIFGIGLSVLFLIASAGIIFWISQDEQERLALKERAGLMAVSDPAAEAEKQTTADATAALEAADRTLRDIDMLLSTLSSDDLPNE
ncbi:MAG: hypothetical protein ACEQSB_01820 [Undibacterium sp.]